MGALADLQAQKFSFASGSPLDAWITSELARLAGADPAVDATLQAIDAIFTITLDSVDHTGGDFTLTITNRLGETFTTGAIAFNATAGTIETAIDSAATGVITGWTNGDITVAGGVLQTADVTLTFDGASVLGGDVLISLTDSRTGGTSGGEIETAIGSTARPAWAALVAYGVLATPAPRQSAEASTSTVTAGDDLRKVPDVVVKSIMRECAAEDKNNSAYFSLQAALYPQDRAPAVETVDTADHLPS